MRVLLSRRLRSRSERGATAIVAALLATVLVGMAAFVVDFGMAYVSKRQLQTAADAAALAAASTFWDKTGTCTTLTSNATYKSAATTAAQSYVDTNRPGASMDSISFGCTSGDLTVDVTTSATTNLAFGGLFVNNDGIDTARTAQAMLSVPPVGAGVRPYALCSLDADVSRLGTGTVYEIQQPGNAHTGSECPTSESGGNWWFVNCPEDKSKGGGPDVAEENLQKGCDDSISIVPNQNPTTASTLSSSLTLNCKKPSDVSSSCLSGGEGNSDLKNAKTYDEWGKLLGKTILLPVFCGSPTCSPDSVNGTGTNSTYPIYKIASVVLCGYHIYDKASGASNVGACSGNSFTSSYVSSVDKKEVRLYLKFTQLMTSGSTGANTCALGTGCDGGARRVQLTK